MESNERQVSRNIKSARIKRGLTQEDVIVLLENKGIAMTKRTYITIENNPFKYSINKLNDIAYAIGCNINEFFLPI